MLICAGMSLDKVSERFGLHRMALYRHWKKHVCEDRKAAFALGPAHLADLQELVAEEGESRLDYLKILRSFHMRAVLKEGERGNTLAMVAAGRALREIIDDIAELHGDVLKYRGPNSLTINNTFLNDPRFSMLQSGLMGIGRDNPDVLPAIISLMETLDGLGPSPTAPKMIEATAA